MTATKQNIYNTHKTDLIGAGPNHNRQCGAAVTSKPPVFASYESSKFPPITATQARKNLNKAIQLHKTDPSELRLATVIGATLILANCHRSFPCM